MLTPYPYHLRSSSPSGLLPIMHHTHTCLTDDLVPMASLRTLCPSHLPLLSLFFACEPPQSSGMHVIIYPYVHNISLCINTFYLTVFPCPSKLFSFGSSNIHRESHIAQHTGDLKACY